MRASDVFGASRFLKATDLAGRSPIVTIQAVSRQDFDSGPKLVIGFAEGSKLLSLNRTNGKTLVGLFGDETADWIGKRIRLVVASVDYKGSVVPAIRIAAADAPAAPARPVDDPFAGLGSSEF